MESTTKLQQAKCIPKWRWKSFTRRLPEKRGCNSMVVVTNRLHVARVVGTGASIQLDAGGV
eukprot:6754363-Pyramimonas_sp.AAC.1